MVKINCTDSVTVTGFFIMRVLFAAMDIEKKEHFPMNFPPRSAAADLRRPLDQLPGRRAGAGRRRRNGREPVPRDAAKPGKKEIRSYSYNLIDSFTRRLRFGGPERKYVRIYPLHWDTL